MTCRLTVYLCGDSTISEIAGLADGLICIAKGPACRVSEIEAGTLNRLAEEAESDFFVFCDGPGALPLNELENLLIILSGPADFASLWMPFDSSSFLSTAWEKYPAEAACLIASPEQQGLVVIHRTYFQDVGQFQDVSSPIWEWLIRSVNSGLKVQMFDREVFSTVFSENDERSSELVPSRPGRDCDWLLKRLLEFDPSCFNDSGEVTTEGNAFQAGLLQMHNYLDESHQVSQSIEGEGLHRDGDYWHAIMHRREPDYGNSKYWFRRVGRHPIFESLAERASEILERCSSDESSDWSSRLGVHAGWDAAAFVNFCEMCARSNDESLVFAAKAIQFAEMSLLLDQTYEDAAGV